MKKLSTTKAVILTSVAFAPIFAFAQGVNDVARGIGTFAGLVDGVTQTVVKSVASLLLALALLAFFYGIVEFIWAKRKGDTKAISDGNKFMTGGLIALFVMFSVYGIIKFAQSTIFGSADMTSISIPNINFKAGSGSTGNTGANTSPGANNSTGGAGSGSNGNNSTGGAGSGSNGSASVSTCNGYVSGGKCYDDGYCMNGCAYTGTGAGSGSGSTNNNSTGGAGSGSNSGADCSTDEDCTGSGEICIAYKCTVGVGD